MRSTLPRLAAVLVAGLLGLSSVTGRAESAPPAPSAPQPGDAPATTPAAAAATATAATTTPAPTDACADWSRFFWAEVRPDETWVDITDPPAAEQPHFEALVNRFIDRLPSEGEVSFARVPPDDPDLPRCFKIGDAFAVVTAQGTQRCTLKGFGVRPGAGATHLFLVLDGVPNAGPDALVVRLAGAGAAIAAPATTVALRPAAGAALAARASRPLWPAARAGLLKGAPAKVRQAFATRLRPAKHVQWFGGRFGSQATGIVTVGIEPKLPGYDWVSAMALVDAKGRPIHIVGKADFGLEHYELNSLVDLDGNGVDEVVFESNYYEGYSYLLLRWTGQTFESVLLTADGA